MSTCISRTVGAVLVDSENRTIADGFNGNLPGSTHCVDGGCDRCNDDTKTGEHLNRCTCVHAEANIISFCAKNGVSTRGTKIYLPISPCLECYKLLVSSGINEIIFHSWYSQSKENIESIQEDLDTRAPIMRQYKCECNRSKKVVKHASS